MPLTWGELVRVQSPLEFTISNAVEKVVRDGDAWEGMSAFAVEIHTHRKT